MSKADARWSVNNDEGLGINGDGLCHCVGIAGRLTRNAVVRLSSRDLPELAGDGPPCVIATANP
jgi:hypothetical protein